VSVEHKRPLYAFILVAVVCGIVIGQTLRSQGLEGVLRPFARPMAIITGTSFAPATAGEPVAPEARALSGQAHGTLRGASHDNRTLSVAMNRSTKAPGSPDEHAWPAFCSRYPGSDHDASDGETRDRDSVSARAPAESHPQSASQSSDPSSDPSANDGTDQSRAQARRDARAHGAARVWALNLGLPWRFEFCGDQDDWAASSRH
jgi:hypothetical protein